MWNRLGVHALLKVFLLDLKLHAKCGVHTSKRTPIIRYLFAVCTPRTWHWSRFLDFKQRFFLIWMIISNSSKTACTPATSPKPFLVNLKLFLGIFSLITSEGRVCTQLSSSLRPSPPSFLKACCLNWQCFLNCWFGSYKTLPVILKYFDLKQN